MPRLLTSRLGETSRSAVRFILVGTLGTILQYLLYDYFLWVLALGNGDINNWLTNLAFTLAFGAEMTINYVMTSYYTFSTRPSWKNFGGFIGSRAVNYIIQIGLLNLSLLILRHWEGQIDTDRWAGLIAIVIAGVINYFMLRVLFRKKKKKED